jgi:hypothetical protein
MGQINVKGAKIKAKWVNDMSKNVGVSRAGENIFRRGEN